MTHAQNIKTLNGTPYNILNEDNGNAVVTRVRRGGVGTNRHYAIKNGTAWEIVKFGIGDVSRMNGDLTPACIAEILVAFDQSAKYGM